MNGIVAMIAKRCGWGAALALMACFGLFIVAPACALADSPHVRATRDTDSCAACHTAHSAAGTPLLRTANSDGAQSDSCVGCHSGADSSATNVLAGSVDSFNLASGHSLATGTSGSAAISGCDTCHNAHGASSDARGIPAAQINHVTVTSAGKELCLACHDASDSWFGPGYPSTSAPTRDAKGFPVSGTWPGPSTYASATNSHRLIPESMQTVGVSEPVLREQGDCLYCHAAHAGANEYDGLITTFTVPVASTLASDEADGSYATLCFGCHGGTKPSGFPAAPVDIKQFSTGGDTAGHRIVTPGGTLPVGAPLPCFECHNPHGSERGNQSMISDELGGSLETSDAPGVREFCLTCHITSDTLAGWDSAVATYTPVTTTDTVVGLPRDGGELRLHLTDGHSQDSTQSCYDCHGDSYAANGNNVHDPSSGTTQLASPLLTIAVIPGRDSSWSVIASASAAPSATVDATGTVMVPDTTPPLTASDAQATYTSSATITLSAVDNSGGSGVAATYYTLDGAATATGTVVSVSIVGTHTLTFWSVDYAGNVEAPTTVTFSIVDLPPPVTQQVSSATRQGRWIADGGT